MMIGIKSMTSGNLLPCARIKQSRWRLMWGMPDVLVEVQQSNLEGPTTSKCWVRESDIIAIPGSYKTASGRLETMEGHQKTLCGQLDELRGLGRDR
jgi:hypothetical protein